MKSHFERLYEYENWANARIIESMKVMDEIPEKALLILSHVLIAQREWLHRVLKTEVTNKFWEPRTLEECIELFWDLHDEWNDFYLKLPEEDLEKVFSYKNSKGIDYDSSLKDILTHLSTHSSYHRGQIVQLLKGYVEPLPLTDFIVFSRE